MYFPFLHRFFKVGNPISAPLLTQISSKLDKMSKDILRFFEKSLHILRICVNFVVFPTYLNDERFSEYFIVLSYATPLRILKIYRIGVGGWPSIWCFSRSGGYQVRNSRARGNKVAALVRLFSKVEATPKLVSVGGTAARWKITRRRWRKRSRRRPNSSIQRRRGALSILTRSPPSSSCPRLPVGNAGIVWATNY